MGQCSPRVPSREALPEHYVKVIAYDPTRGRQTTALAFIVNRPSVEPSFTLDRIAGPGRTHRFRLIPTYEDGSGGAATSSANGAGEASTNGAGD